MKDNKVLICLKHERKELEERRNKLETFIKNTGEDIRYAHYELLIQQLEVINDYIRILSIRINDLLNHIND